MSPKHEFPHDPFAPEGQIAPEIVPLEYEQEVERTPIAIIDSVLERINEEDWDGDEDGDTPQKPTLH